MTAQSQVGRVQVEQGQAVERRTPRATSRFLNPMQRWILRFSQSTPVCREVMRPWTLLP
jgi:hypothetical protein